MPELTIAAAAAPCTEMPRPPRPGTPTARSWRRSRRWPGTFDPPVREGVAVQRVALMPDGAVLVIGSGQSGAQIAEDLQLAGRDRLCQRLGVCRRPCL